MPRNRTYATEKAAIRKMLSELGSRATLRDSPMPSVFVDNDATAQFYGASWLTVYADVLAFFTSKLKTVTPKSLT